MRTRRRHQLPALVLLAAMAAARRSALAWVSHNQSISRVQDPYRKQPHVRGCLAGGTWTHCIALRAYGCGGGPNPNLTVQFVPPAGRPPFSQSRPSPDGGRGRLAPGSCSFSIIHRQIAGSLFRVSGACFSGTRRLKLRRRLAVRRSKLAAQTRANFPLHPFLGVELGLGLT